jgi:transposase InsO family protein
MPWQERRTMGLKMEFVEKAVLPDANLSEICRQFGISRATGHKWVKRFREHGYVGLEEKSRRPGGVPLSTGEDVVVAVLEARDAHPSWGPKKLHLLLARRLKKQTPSSSTIARILRRVGKIKLRRKKMPLSIVEQAPSIEVKRPNDLWTADFKGWWKTGDDSRCEPLTVRDALSRYVFTCTAMSSALYEPTRTVFESLFRKHGLPNAIQVDNGSPFICVNARAGLTRLSAWWVALGIRVVRSRPGCPQDNGAHERMHRDISEDVEAFAAASMPQQQYALDRWRQEFNHVRPHEALLGKTPSEVYKPKNKRALHVPLLFYPDGWIRRRVHGVGVIAIDGQKYRVGSSLVGYDVGLQPIEALRFRMWFRDIDLGLVEIIPGAQHLQRLVSDYRPKPSDDASMYCSSYMSGRNAFSIRTTCR